MVYASDLISIFNHLSANCDGTTQAQDIFPEYLMHSKIVNILADKGYATAAGEGALFLHQKTKLTNILSD